MVFLLTILFVPLALFRVRFLLYMLVPLILCAAYTWRELPLRIALHLGGWRGNTAATWLIVALLVFSPTLPWYMDIVQTRTNNSRETLIGALEWLRLQPAVAGREGVLSEWDYGHLARYFAARPVVVNPFGTDLGPEGMRDAATFFLATDSSVAEDVLSRRNIGYVLLANPLTEACFAWGFAPTGG